MDKSINPFQQLYFSDDIQSASDYVELFSDKVLQTAINPIFHGGNVVLSGTQGCGKTMILSLLKPETRIAYWRKQREYPVNEKLRNFVSAGINLTRSQISDLVHATLGNEEVDQRDMPNYFSDFFNCWVVYDLIQSIELIGNEPEIFNSLVKLSNLNSFLRSIVRDDCWFGSMEGVSEFSDFKQALKNRIIFYRKWVNGNYSDPLPPREIQETKTNIGEPIARVAEHLRSSGVIEENTPVLIRVDQIEELHRAFTPRTKNLLLSFRKVLNRAFAARDTRVNYRAGTRRYGWKDEDYLTVWGSDAKLEERRDYLLIDMDAELFARGEKKNSIFETFAEDTFLRRVKYFFGESAKNVEKNIAKRILGKHPTAEQRISYLSKKATPEQIDRALALKSPKDKNAWSKEWRIFLHELYKADHQGMLDAILASAWGRQTGGANRKTQHREFPPPQDSPWKTRKWWRKERLDQAVLQLTVRSQQRLLWWGFADIISLSGGNITIFLHICHRIWDAFLKSQYGLPESKQVDLLKDGEIDKTIQAGGIQFASNEWFNKLPEEPGGNSRQAFIEKLGTLLNDSLISDLSMSYPGGNGISISLNEYKSENIHCKNIKRFIEDMVDYGVLFSTEHSSKTKASGRRIKFYLTPIFCPRYQLPESRTKEPYYWTMQNIMEVIEKSKANIIRTIDNSQSSVDNSQYTLDF